MRSNLFIKTISCIVAFTFLWSQFIYAGDTVSLRTLASQTRLAEIMPHFSALEVPLAIQKEFFEQKIKANIDLVRRLDPVYARLAEKGKIAEEDLEKVYPMIYTDKRGHRAYYYINEEGYFFRVVDQDKEVEDDFREAFLRREDRLEDPEILNGYRVGKYRITYANITPVELCLKRLYGEVKLKIHEEEIPKESISGRLRLALVRKGCTQKELAEAVEVSRQAVSGWVKGKTKLKDRKKIRRIAEFLGVTEAYLIGEEDLGIEEELEKSISGRLRLALVRKGCTQKELAEAVEVSQEAVSRWVKGKTKLKDREMIGRIAEFLGVTEEYLIGGEEIEIDAVIPGRLRLALMEKGCTQGELAEAVGVSQQVVSGWVKGKTKLKDREMIRQIAAFLGVTVEYLIGEEGLEIEEELGKSISGRLRLALMKKGCTQGALAQAAGVSQQVVSGWIRGKTKLKDRETIRRIAKFLEVTEEYLIGDEEIEMVSVIPERLRLALMWKGCTQRELAEAVGVRRDVVSGWVQGRTKLKDSMKIRDVAAFLGVREIYLIGREDSGIEEELEKSISGRRRLALMRKGCTQRELAEAVGVRRGVVSGWIQGRIKLKDMGTIGRIAEFLGVTVEYLIGEEDRKHRVQVISDPEDLEDMSFGTTGTVIIDSTEELCDKFTIKFLKVIPRSIANAIYEIYKNAMKHGNKFDETKKVTIEWHIDEYMARFVVTDEGTERFNPQSLLDMDEETVRSRRDRAMELFDDGDDIFYGGALLGIYRAGRGSDEIHFEDVEDEEGNKIGTRVTIVKYMEPIRGFERIKKIYSRMKDSARVYTPGEAAKELGVSRQKAEEILDWLSSIAREIEPEGEFKGIEKVTGEGEITYRWLDPDSINPDIFRDYDYRSNTRGSVDFSPKRLFFMTLTWIHMAKERAEGQGIDNNKVLIARDCRKTDPDMAEAVVRAVEHSGLQTVYIGEEPDCAASYAWAVRIHKPLMGIFLTASHIRTEDAMGAKVSIRGRSGELESLTTQEIKEMSRRLLDRILRNPNRLGLISKESVPRMLDDVEPTYVQMATLENLVAMGMFKPDAEKRALYDLGAELKSAEDVLAVLKRYEDIVDREARPLSGLKIVVEAAHTPSGKLAARVYERLGAEAIVIHKDVRELTGRHRADPAKIENLEALMDRMEAAGAHLGVAFDLDGDRGAVVVPAKEIDAITKRRFAVVSPGDLTQALLPFFQKRGYSGKVAVVRDVVSTSAVDKKAMELGYKTYKTDAGYTFVKQKREQLEEQGYTVPICAEGVGHSFTHAAGAFEDPIMVSLFFAVTGKEYMGENPQSTHPFIEVLGENTVPYMQSVRFQPLFGELLLSQLGWTSEQGKPTTKVIASGREMVIAALKEDFEKGKEFDTPAGRLKIGECEIYKSPETGESRYADIKFTLNGKDAGSFVFRASSNDPTWVCIFETPLREGETPESESLRVRYDSVGGVVLDYLETRGYARVAGKGFKYNNKEHVEETLRRYRGAGAAKGSQLKEIGLAALVSGSIILDNLPKILAWVMALDSVSIFLIIIGTIISIFIATFMYHKFVPMLSPVYYYKPRLKSSMQVVVASAREGLESRGYVFYDSEVEGGIEVEVTEFGVIPVRYVGSRTENFRCGIKGTRTMWIKKLKIEPDARRRGDGISASILDGRFIPIEEGLRERLTLTSEGETQRFISVAKHRNRDGLILAEEEETGRLFVIKKILTDMDRRHSSWVQEVRNRVPEVYPYTYHPKIMSAGAGQWTAVVYPYIEGMGFYDYFERYKGRPLRDYILEVVNIVIKAFEVAGYLEKRGLPGVWDFGSNNIIITPDGNVVFIDYTKTDADPINSLHFLLDYWLVEYLYSKGQDMLKALGLDKSVERNRKIKELYGLLRQKVKDKGFSSIEEYVEELAGFRKELADCLSPEPEAERQAAGIKGSSKEIGLAMLVGGSFLAAIFPKILALITSLQSVPILVIGVNIIMILTLAIFIYRYLMLRLAPVYYYKRRLASSDKIEVSSARRAIELMGYVFHDRPVQGGIEVRVSKFKRGISFMPGHVLNEKERYSTYDLSVRNGRRGIGTMWIAKRAGEKREILRSAQKDSSHGPEEDIIVLTPDMRAGPVGKKVEKGAEYAELWEIKVKDDELAQRGRVIERSDEHPYGVGKEYSKFNKINVPLLRRKLRELVSIYGPGILAVIDAVRVVDNIGADKLARGEGGIVPYGMVVEEDGRNILLLDVDAFDIEMLLYIVLGHELKEGIMSVVPCESDAVRELTTNFDSLKFALQLIEKGRLNLDDKFMRKLSECGADLQFFQALQVLVDAGVESGEDSRIMAVAIEHMRAMPYYMDLFQQFSFAEGWQDKIGDVQNRYEAALRVFNDIMEAKVGKDEALQKELKEVVEEIDINMRVIKTFTGKRRIVGLERLPRLLQKRIGAAAKVIWGRGHLKKNLQRVAQAQRVQDRKRQWIVVDSEWRKQYEQEALEKQIAALQDIKDENGERLFYVVGSIEEVREQDADAFSEENPRVIHLFDIVDWERVTSDKKEDRLYLPTLYNVSSSLFIAAHMLLAGGKIDAIEDNLTRGIIKSLYRAVLGTEPADTQLVQLFTAPWKILPDVILMTQNLNELRIAIAELENEA